MSLVILFVILFLLWVILALLLDRANLSHYDHSVGTVDDHENDTEVTWLKL